MTAMNPVKLYWWNDAAYPNLGDEITSILLRELYKIDCSWDYPKFADLIGAGSTLGWLRPTEAKGAPKNLNVVGSGFMFARERLLYTPSLNVISVRGHLSRQKLNGYDIGKVSVGDPGLLVSALPIPASNNHYRLGFVPHHSSFNRGDSIRKMESIGAKILDIRTHDWSQFFADLTSCEVIVSESLHGLVFSDALGVPNVWLRSQKAPSYNDFKYFDYFSSVGRDFNANLTQTPSSIVEAEEMASYLNPLRVYNLSRNIKLAFDAALENVAS